MNHKVFRSVFVLAMALGCASVMMRMKDEPVVRTPAARDAHADPLSRPLACYRVFETPAERGMDYRGASYKATISEGGVSFGAVPELNSVWAGREFSLEFGAPRLAQGRVQLECGNAKFSRTAFGTCQIDRGAVIEEYVFENRRVEQLFRIPAALGSGALVLTIPATSDLGGPVITHTPNDGTFKDMLFAKGGLAFCNASGETRLAYHSAVAIDHAGREVALAPRYEDGKVVLELPAEFTAGAAYPIVIDPWLDFQGSGTGGGISSNGSHSESPALALTSGGQPFIAWSDNSAAGSDPNNTDIYLKWWNGFEFFPLGTSANPGGISSTPGKSVNPSLSLGVMGSPIVAWEDDSSGPVSILVKKWPLIGEPGVGTWSELLGSGHGQGVSFQFSPAQHPSVTGIVGLIPGVVTTNPSTGVTTSTPAQFIHCPVVAYDLPLGGGTQIICQVYYPGAPPQPDSAANPGGLPAVPEGWYSYGILNGIGVSPTGLVSISNTPTGFISQYPSIAACANNRVALSWQDTRNGNYEIYFAQFTLSGPNQSFRVAPDATNPFTVMDMLPAGNFAAIGGSAAGGGVSNTANPSQFPSLAFDTTGGTSNFTVAWQETEAAAPPNPGTTSQIYVARSVAGGAFAGLGGSAGVGGISQTLNHASTPSLDVNGGYIGVAWADDSNSRSSIYVRRFFLGAGPGTWDQVGFQGSAFPAINAETQAPIGGVSQSLNFSIQPKLKLDQFGSPIVAWTDGSGATFDVRLKVFSPNAPGIASGIATTNPLFSTSLRQTLTDPTLGTATDVAVAGFANGTTIFLSSRVFTETLIPPGTSLRLELEVQPQGAPFTNSPNFQTLFVAPDDPAVTPANISVLKFDGLPNANYHWQARTADQIGRTSAWVQFATDASGVSFRINAAAPPGGGGGNGPVNTGGTTTTGNSKSQCGLTGLEAIALLGALRLLRRRRSK